MGNVLDVFDFKKEEFKEKQIDVILSMLSKEEKKVFNLLKFSDDALTATQVYDYYIDKIINEDPSLKKKIDDLKSLLNTKNKKPLEIKASFARQNKIKVPTNRTVTRVLENLKDAGFIVKRKTNNKKAKAYYCLIPNLKLILEEKDVELKKKKEIDQMMSRVKQLKDIIKEKNE
ncbi:hypothetical protein CEE44_01505 [Candidatus Woesearchaeota archaeon B3_Woes]|nr:MAG: hypothetical protein CEE44_01505 [Candidatus Woesearchaeota archaeon B3_Woes]